MYRRLNALREKHHLTYQQLADLSNLPVGTVKSILSGATVSPGFENVCALLRAMGESVDDFCGKAPPAASSEINPSASHYDSAMYFSAEMNHLSQNAVRDVYQSAAIRSLQVGLMWWRAIALVLLTFDLLVLGWDVLHPEVGYIVSASAYSLNALRSIVP